MTNDDKPIQPLDELQKKGAEVVPPHPLATGLGAVGGGAVGAAIGRSISGKAGAAIGAVAGAVVGGLAGQELAQVVGPELELGIGADDKPIELPSHYSWEELQALSKPQGGQNQAV
ncbi:MAG: glycine zipper 2TM domain-containing protein [Chroococcidiopsidaceae cyanobacterium CP_BM_ER_R8_30]|nr:glycine zipper 2TM domain-containing protein [Chroococcidiopsidaceae cyanobacterium CP_BM_ER_R8_30]